MLAIFPVGFDEKFIIRALMRNQTKKGDKLLAVVPKGYEKEEKAVNALRAIRDITVPIVGEENFKVIELLTTNGENMVLEIKNAIEDNLTEDKRIIAILSGGMRPLNVVILLATITVDNTRVKVESDFENLSGFISLELGPFLAPRNIRWINILCGLKTGKSVRKIAEDLGVSPATISRELKDIQRYSLVEEISGKNRPLGYTLTRAGVLYLKLHGGICLED
ncbi:CRISPR-associated CARF protein Csa3 [Pyrococcus sp. ST04]|uniref:CRISPR-associated CARF protein Csa3 n=1 Tax=Pyrococcus sp. ST04 TaxID=1183377 RepID=UPI0002605C94|nr:CRISPR-associated CARF protein Csa3 [Pyrococcus sp. ST04]AFK22396.1 CRISPR locus-related DNA-binding protein [Pyrococcus sp. ST04]